MDLESKKKFIIDVLFLVTIAAVVVFVVKYMIGWFIPFLVGILLVAMMQPLSNFVSKRISIKNKIASFISLVILYITIGVLIWFGGAALVNKCADIVSRIPEIYNDYLMPMLVGLNDWAVGIANRFAPDTVELISEMSNTMITELASLAADFSSGCLNALTGQIIFYEWSIISIIL